MKFVARDLVDTEDISSPKLKQRDVMKTIAVIVVCAFLAYQGLAYGVKYVVGNISFETERQWFDGLGRHFCGDMITEGRSADIFKRLQEQERNETGGLKLCDFNIDLPNAVAIPGGYVGVTESLVDLVKSEIGLAFVLAHEIGHHHHRHGLRRLGTSLAWNALQGFVVGTGHFGAELTNNLVESGHSRQQEQEADDYALRLVYAVYGTTEGSTELFEWLSKRQGVGDSLNRFFASHPLGKERIKAIRRLAAELESRQ